MRSEIFVVKILGTGVALEIDDGSVAKVILKQTDPWVDFQPTPWTWVRAHAIMTISMAEEKQPQSDESPGKTAEGTVRIQTAGTVTSSGSVRVRLIQQSPTANPKLVEAARKFAQRLKEKEGDEEEHIDYIPEAPLILPVPQK